MTILNVNFPVKLNDNYPCQGRGVPDGQFVTFDDLLYEGQKVAKYSDGQGNTWGPYGVVVRRDDGLWIVPSDEPKCGWALLAEGRICDKAVVGIYHGIGGKQPVCREHADLLRREWGIHTQPLPANDRLILLEDAAREVVDAQAGMCVDGHSAHISAEHRRDMAIQRLRDVLNAS